MYAIPSAPSSIYLQLFKSLLHNVRWKLENWSLTCYYIMKVMLVYCRVCVGAARVTGPGSPCRCFDFVLCIFHYSDVIMSKMASQITSLTNVYPNFYSGADQRKHQSSPLLAFVCGIHRWLVNSPHKWPVTQNVSIWWRHHCSLHIHRWMALIDIFDCPTSVYTDQ